ncbi:MAG: hypothetical protein KJ025_01865 [Burkholderiales bacterium]|nr:hypothetical protein [Burkholderiales bacterium]
MNGGCALECAASGFAGVQTSRKRLRLLLGLALFFAVFRAEGASIIFADSSEFNYFGTISGTSHLYLEPATFSTIGRLRTFDSSLGTLTGVKVYASFVGSYTVLSHCSAPFCDFTTSGGFSDGFYSGPAGSNFSASGYGVPINLTPTSQGFTGSSASRSGSTHFSEQVVIDPIYFSDYLDTAGDYVFFTKQGDKHPEARLWHENLLSSSQPFLEACIDNCGEGVEFIALGVWLASQTHAILYNDSHFKFYGRRFFQVDYTFDPFPSSTPISAPGTAHLVTIALGVIVLMGRRPHARSDRTTRLPRKAGGRG